MEETLSSEYTKWITQDNKFLDLIAHFPSIENALRDELETFIRLVLGKKLMVRGNYYSYKRQLYNFKANWEKFERKFSFWLIPIKTHTQNISLIKKEIQINHFGEIKTIVFYADSDFSNLGYELLTIIEPIITKCYKALELKYSYQFREFENTDSIFKDLYMLIDMQIQKETNNNLLDFIHLSITNLETNKFRIHFTQKKLTSTIDLLKQNQHFEYCPFELVSSLIISESPDSFIVRNILSSERFICLPMEKLDSMENYPVWLAETDLLKDNNIAVLEVSNLGWQSLQINCPKRINKELEKIILPIKHTITEQFSSNIAHNRKMQKLYDKYDEIIANNEGKIKIVRKVSFDLFVEWLATKLFS